MPVEIVEIHAPPEKEKKPKSKRQHHSKSRNGCLTCKIRRVKCDEKRPRCLRCKESQMKCDGYPTPAASKTREATAKTPAVLAPKPGETIHERPLKLMASYELNHLHGSTQDQRSFDFFINKTAPLLSSNLDKWFWSKFLLQISNSEPTIWHSILALSSLHEERFRDPYGRDEEAKAAKRRYAIQHYNKAITSLTRKTSRKPPSLEVVLVSCVVFISLETLLGNVGGAINHLQSGMGIIRDYKGEKSRSQTPEPIPSPGSSASSTTSNTKMLEENVIPVLENLNCNTFMYGRTAPSQLPLDLIDKPLEEFADLKEARESINAVMSAGQQLAVIAYSKEPIDDLQGMYAMLYSYQQKLVIRAKGWGEPFERLMAQPRMQNLSTEDRREVALLRLTHRTSLIWANNALYTQEVSFDEFVSDFEIAVELGEQTMPEEGKETSFSYEGGNIIPIYFTAVRCRNPVIRRRALGLLKRMPPREGFWDTNITARVVETLIELEEMGLEDLRDPTGAIVPSEWSRVHQTNLKPEVVGEKRKVIVTFVKKMDTGAENWDLQREFFVD